MKENRKNGWSPEYDLRLNALREKTVRDVLAEFDVKDAKVSVNDRGALAFAIRARMQCAITRAAESSFDWSKGDPAEGGAVASGKED